MATKSTKKQTEVTAENLLEMLQKRFEKNMHRHKGIKWPQVQERLSTFMNGKKKEKQKFQSLLEMEKTGGEPDVIEFDQSTGEFIFADCSPETPKGRRSICYDREALESRKQHKPAHNALDMAAEMGIELLTEEQYFELQKHGPYDTKTSSWLITPKEVRKLGGALFGDYRFGRTFIYHNGADSYYGVRGFRGRLRV
ncbi:MAG TPA: DUF4256 domain-containing protein [Mariniphaga sp.]|nr:DUF4256 domain-containing protein [Mariniphaga sp.]